MIKKYNFTGVNDHLILFASVVIIAFVYGLFVGFCGRAIFISSSDLHKKDTVYGRFGRVADSLRQAN